MITKPEDCVEINIHFFLTIAFFKKFGTKQKAKGEKQETKPGVSDETELDPVDISKLRAVFCIHWFTSTQNQTNKISVLENNNNAEDQQKREQLVTHSSTSP